MPTNNTKRSHLPPTFECTHCYDKFAELSAQLQHMESYCDGGIDRNIIAATAHRVDPFEIITLDTNNENEDGSHMSHGDEYDYNRISERWICLKCDNYKEFSSENAVKQHLDSPHHHSYQFYCRGCNKVFSNMSGLAQHNENKPQCFPKGRWVMEDVIYALRS